MRHARIVILIALVVVTLLAPAGQDAAQAAPSKLTSTQVREITDEYLFKASLAKFRQLHEDKPYKSDDELDWSTDTCSWSPDKPYNYDFRAPCWRHDFGYRNYKRQHRFTEANRKRIDDNFHQDMYSECSKQWGPSGSWCRRVASRYYNFVRVCGAKENPKVCPGWKW